MFHSPTSDLLCTIFHASFWRFIIPNIIPVISAQYWEFSHIIQSMLVFKEAEKNKEGNYIKLIVREWVLEENSNWKSLKTKYKHSLIASDLFFLTDSECWLVPFCCCCCSGYSWLQSKAHFVISWQSLSFAYIWLPKKRELFEKYSFSEAPE